MKTFKQLLAVSIMICGTLLMSSCTDEISSDKPELTTGSVISMTNTEIKKEFGKALAKVLVESAPARELMTMTFFILWLRMKCWVIIRL